VARTKWRVAIEETSTEKADRYLERYRATMLQDRQRCLGSYVFFWGHKQERTHTWYGMFLPSGERTEAVGVMRYLWTGKWPSNRAPRIGALSIDGLQAEDSVIVEPGSRQVAKVEATDRDGDALSFRWEVLPEPTHFGYGGMGERKPAALPDAVVAGNDGSATLVAPARPGPYRLFVVVLDGQDNAATGNIPFYVEAETAQ
jgi:hypothetical protein